MFLPSLLLFLPFFLPSILAQDPGSLSPCAVACINKHSNCPLATPQCLCPHRQDIDSCIGQTCPISDVEDSLHAIDSFCQTTTSTSTPPSPTTQTTPRPAPTHPAPTHTIKTLPTPNPGPTPAPTIQQPTITQATLSPIPTTISTSSTTTTPLTSSPPTTTPPSSTPSQAPQTVIVFSTQFPSSTPPTGNASGATWNFISTPHLVAPLLLAAFFSSSFLLDLI